jgi:hypothetical protein
MGIQLFVCSSIIGRRDSHAGVLHRTYDVKRTLISGGYQLLAAHDFACVL